jgi:tRNA pseudouridine13 synthase
MASAPPLQEADLGLESPRKRQKLDSPPPSISSIATTTTQPIGKPVAKMDEPMNPMVISETGFQPEREKQCAIIHFVNDSNPGFTGVLKQRYAFMFLLYVSYVLFCPV